MIIKMLTEFWRKMEEPSENFNKEIGNISTVPNRSHSAKEYKN